MQRLWLLQNSHFGSKIKTAQKCEKRFYNHNRIALRKKPLEKNIKQSRNEAILKIGYLAKAIAYAKAVALENDQLSSKNKIAKNMRKAILQAY